MCVECPHKSRYLAPPSIAQNLAFKKKKSCLTALIIHVRKIIVKRCVSSADTKIDVLRPLLSLKIIYCARALINTSAINPCQFWEPLQVNSCKKVMPKVEWWTRECADLS